MRPHSCLPPPPSFITVVSALLSSPVPSGHRTYVPQVAEDNFDDPNLLDFELLLKNVTEIQSGRATQTPVYSFQFSARTGFVTTPVPQSKVLIVEGTYALKAILRPVYDIAISVTGRWSRYALHWLQLCVQLRSVLRYVLSSPANADSCQRRRRPLRPREARSEGHYSRARAHPLHRSFYLSNDGRICDVGRRSGRTPTRSSTKSRTPCFPCTRPSSSPTCVLPQSRFKTLSIRFKCVLAHEELSQFHVVHSLNGCTSTFLNDFCFCLSASIAQGFKEPLFILKSDVRIALPRFLPTLSRSQP
jgi:hypothetical protein